MKVSKPFLRWRLYPIKSSSLICNIGIKNLKNPAGPGYIGNDQRIPDVAGQITVPFHAVRPQRKTAKIEFGLLAGIQYGDWTR